jgi:RecA-family ATPase
LWLFYELFFIKIVLLTKMDTPLQFFDINAINQLPVNKWIIQDIIPDNSTIILYGESGCGKTFVAIDISLHITNNMMWNSNVLMKPGIVIYLAGEGIYGFSNRLNAWQSYYKQISPLFFIIPINNISIWMEDNINKLILTLGIITEKMNKTISLIIVDTLARASYGLDENSSKDMGIFLRNFEIVKEKFSCSILYIHHQGKDSSKGMRGSSVLLGAIDTCINIYRTNDDKIIFKVEKQKDGINNQLIFKLIKHKNSLVISSIYEQCNDIPPFDTEDDNNFPFDDDENMPF